MIFVFLLLFFAKAHDPAAGRPPLQDSLTVYIFLHDECVISQYYTPALSRLAETYRDRHIGFTGYFPMATQDRIDSFAAAYKLSFPLQPDTDYTYVQKFDATIMPEAAVWDHRTEKLIYRGRIDDSYVRVGKRKLHPKSRDLEEIIKSWIENQTPDTLVETHAIGCVIDIRQ